MLKPKLVLEEGNYDIDCSIYLTTPMFNRYRTSLPQNN